MRQVHWLLNGIFTILLLAGAAEFSWGQDLPVINGKKVVANVNDEWITLDEYVRERAMAPDGNSSGLLQRLINTRLILQEANRMGLDELKEIENMLDAFSRVTLREALMERRVKEVKVDEKEVESLYKEWVKEWKMSSVLLEKEETAKKMIEEIKAGKPFDELVKHWVVEGRAKQGEQGQFLKAKEVEPQIAAVVSKMKVGSVSPIIPISSGFVIVKLDDIRYPKDPETLKQARGEALKLKKVQVLKDYSSVLTGKYAKIDQEVLKSINYESEHPGFDALLKDRRVVAEIKGEKSIHVWELTEHLKMQFYHGVEKAIEMKRLNSKKGAALDEMIYKRVFRKEALRMGLDKTENYKNKVQEYKNSLLFGAFVNKAIIPDIQLKEDETRAYYHEHRKEYSSPEMVKITSLAFSKRAEAEEAMERLRKGAEFQWVVAHGTGRVDPNTKDLLIFDGKWVATQILPEGLQKAIHGAKAGEYRLYEGTEGYFYILDVQEFLAARPQPYEEAKETIKKKMFEEKVKKSVEDYAGKLRIVSKITVYGEGQERKKR
jgi:parvulin-like peptidyl-prolyl isomerase